MKKNYLERKKNIQKSTIKKKTFFQQGSSPISVTFQMDSPSFLVDVR